MDTINPKTLAIHRVESSDESEFQALITIYTAAHPRSERKLAAQLAVMISRPEYLFIVITCEDVVVGFAITICFAKSNACLLEYMAIAEDKRRQGLGNFLFKELVELPRIEGKYLLAEVDSDKLPFPDRLGRTRRKRFYRNLGCREVEGLDYIMPPVSSRMPPAMDIMVYSSNLPQKIPKDLLRKWLKDIYVNVYAKQATDPRIDKMLENSPENPALI